MVEPKRPPVLGQAVPMAGARELAKPPNPDEESGFMSRWSKRKTDMRSGVPVVDAPVRVQAAASPGRSVVDGPGAMPSTQAPHARDMLAEPELPPLTLQDAQSLTPESDFKPFMAKSVSPEVKNAAMKKLWADPHYNIMDRLDTYIDDYSKPDPIPPELLRKLVSAQFLDLFDEEKNRRKAEAEAERLAAQQAGAVPGAESVAQISAENGTTAAASNASGSPQALGDALVTSQALQPDPQFSPLPAASTDGSSPGPVAH